MELVAKHIESGISDEIGTALRLEQYCSPHVNDEKFKYTHANRTYIHYMVCTNVRRHTDSSKLDAHTHTLPAAQIHFTWSIYFPRAQYVNPWLRLVETYTVLRFMIYDFQMPYCWMSVKRIEGWMWNNSMAQRGGAKHRSYFSVVLHCTNHVVACEEVSERNRHVFLFHSFNILLTGRCYRVNIRNECDYDAVSFVIVVKHFISQPSTDQWVSVSQCVLDGFVQFSMRSFSY